jgi:VIT1/CCC1 family predicted Fe2+/Mn2+ transporter
MANSTRDELIRQHAPEAVAARLGRARSPQSVSDAMLGGVDGCITTFAIVSGSVGAGFPPHVSLILGIAKLFADGLSMAVSNYESIKAHNEFIDATRREEERHIEQIPEGEREEVRQIFAQKGFADDVLERIVATITADRKLWIETMLAEEHGLRGPHPSPMKSGAVTFAAFVLVGVVPLLPLLITALSVPAQLYASLALAGIVFFAIGTLKSVVFGRPPLGSGLATLLTGGSAAAVAYVIGYLLRDAFGITG